MVDATTTYLGLTLPTVGADSNTWGGLNNANTTAIDALWVNIGNVAFGTAATKTVGTSGATVPLLNGTNTWAAAQTFSGGLSGTLTGNAASATTATTVSDGAITPGKMSTGGPNWDTSGNLALAGVLEMASGDLQLGVFSTERVLHFSVAGNHRLQFNQSTGTLTFVVDNIPVFSIDISGNVIAKGTITPSGTPAT